MQVDGGDELLRKLSSILRKHENPILRGESKVCLTSTCVVYLNSCFDQLTSGADRQSENHYGESCHPCVTYLHDLTRKALSLKVVPGPNPRFDNLLNITHFKCLQFLEIKKVPLGYFIGLQGLRQQLKGLTCFRSVFALDEVFVCCGGDLSSTPFTWQHLQQVNLSYNSIDHLDDSVKVLPVLEALNLSHNNIVSPQKDDCWQFLTGLNYLNLGYNQLNKVPSLPTVTLTRFQLRTLILRNNNIQNLKGIQHFTVLQILDVSNNCIASFDELFPLAKLQHLTALHLAGNPVCFHEDYRLHTVSCLSPVPRHGDMYLDNQKLSSLEKSFVGSCVQPASLLSYIPNQPLKNLQPPTDKSQESLGLPQGLSSEDSETDGVKKKKKNRKLKTRQISILDDVDDDSRLSSPTTSSPAEQSLDHSQDIERLEKARDLGGAHWLPAINNVVHGETFSASSEQPLLPQGEQPRSQSEQPLPQGDQPLSQGEQPLRQGDQPLRQEEKVEALSSSLYSPTKQDVTTGSSSRRSSSSESVQSDEDVHQPFLVTVKTLHIDEHDEEDEELLVTITQHFIRERDCDNGKVVCKLEISNLLLAHLEETEDGDVVVHLKFDYLSRDRRERYYIMEDRESCEQMLGILFPLIMSKEESENVIVTEHLQCLKCSAHFTEQASHTRDHICPDCGSTNIIEINPSDKTLDTMVTSVGTKTNNDSQLPRTGNNWLSDATKMPDLISNSDSPKAAYAPDIYNSNKDDSQKTAPANEVKTYAMATAGGFKTNDKSDNNQDVKASESTERIYTINNTARYQVSDTTGYRINASGKDTSVKPNSLPTRTSVLSNSLESYERKSIAKEKSSESKSNIARPRVIDSPLTLKTSSRTNEKDSSASSTQPDSQRKNSAPQSNGAPSLTPNSNVIRSLFTKFSNKMSGPLLSSSPNNTQDLLADELPRTTVPVVMNSGLIFDISPDEFKKCDHRLKLYFEVSLFTGGAEEYLCCLIKAKVVVYGDTEEISSLLVVSNMTVYICKLVESAGVSAVECLSMISCYPLEDLYNMDFGLGCQSFRLEFSGESPGCCTFHVRDETRCEKFLHLLIKTANYCKGAKDLTSLVVNRTHPQTLAHIRSQVLGVRQEDLTKMAKQYLEQLKHFTEPPLIRDRKSLLRHYSQCFVGREFIDWLIRNREVNTRTEAVELAQRLVDAALIEHVSKECKFEDKEQFYRFRDWEESNDSIENGENGDNSMGVDDSCDMDTLVSAAVMAYRVLDPCQPLKNVKPVTIIVTRTHIALAEENHQWPFPRYLEPAPSLNGPQFHSVVRHKMTDVASLEFFTDSPCHVAMVISEEDAPIECAESSILIQTETQHSLSLLVKAIKEPWEDQFGVELQTSFLPSLCEAN